MNPPFYEKILDLALVMTNADSFEQRWEAHSELHEICETHKKSVLDHPFQWETLGDFTHDADIAISIYEKALELALSLKLNDYIASINLAIAKRYCETNNSLKAQEYAEKADMVARHLEDLDIRQEISELLVKIAANNKNQNGQISAD